MLYTAGVRRFLLHALALLMLVSSVADGVYCIDDCGRAGLSTINVATTGAADCPFCSGILATVVTPFTAEIAPLEAVPDTVIVHPVLLLATGLERPPRA